MRPPSPLPLSAEDAASVCGMRRIHCGGFSRPQANDAAHAVRATYFRTAVRCLLNVLRHGNSSAFCAPPSSLTAEDVASVRGILCIHAGGFSRSPAFVIDRGRCRFRARNALHSFRRLLTPAPAIDRGRCRFCAQNTLHSFRQLLTRPQAMLFLLSALHIFVHLCVVF